MCSVVHGDKELCVSVEDDGLQRGLWLVCVCVCLYVGCGHGPLYSLAMYTMKVWQ